MILSHNDNYLSKIIKSIYIKYHIIKHSNVKYRVFIFLPVYIMKLNIVTAAANSVGKSILEKIANKEDITIGLSRRWCEIANVIDWKITDLTNQELTQKELMEVLSTIKNKKIDNIKLYHNCWYAVAELPWLSKDNQIFKYHPDLLPKLFLQDDNWDGIDDRTYNSAISSFINVFSAIQKQFKDTPLSLWIICSLTDKKEYITSVFQSMVRTNRKLRAIVEKLTMEYNNINWICVSASTVRTPTEEIFRQYSWDKEYRASVEYISTILVDSMQLSHHTYIDIDAYVKHPEYEIRFKNEMDDQFTERLKSECLWPFNY